MLNNVKFFVTFRVTIFHNITKIVVCFFDKWSAKFTMIFAFGVPTSILRFWRNFSVVILHVVTCRAAVCLRHMILGVVKIYIHIFLFKFFFHLTSYETTGGGGNIFFQEIYFGCGITEIKLKQFRTYVYIFLDIHV